MKKIMCVPNTILPKSSFTMFCYIFMCKCKNYTCSTSEIENNFEMDEFVSRWFQLPTASSQPSD